MNAEENTDLMETEYCEEKERNCLAPERGVVLEG
jgi:hypothetical protein